MKTLFKDKKWWLETLKILIIGIIINIACFFMCSFTGHCETVSSVLPYLCQSVNTFYDETMVNTVLSEINTKYPDDDIYSKRIIISLGAEYNWYTYNDYVQIPTYRVYVIPDGDNIASTWSSGANFSNFQYENANYWVELNVIPFVSYTVQPSMQNSFHYYVNKSTSTGLTAIRLFGAYNPVTISNSFYDVQVPNYNYPIYVNGAITTTDPQLTQGYVLSYTTDIIIGEFTDLPPLENILNNITNSWTDSTTTTLPNTDNSASVSDNLRNFLSTMQGNLANSINNLGSNVKSYFDKVQQKLTDTTNAILGGIHNGFATLNQNFKDFFGAKLDSISEKLDSIIDLLSQLQNNANTDFEDNWEDSQVKQDFDSLSQSVETSFTVWSDTSEPNEFKIPLHVENVAILNCNQTQYIDLGLFSPVLPYIRTIMWALMVYSLVYTIIDSLANYLNGGDE